MMVDGMSVILVGGHEGSAQREAKQKQVIGFNEIDVVSRMRPSVIS